MRFLHTGDWHIGRAFAVSRMSEQEAVLTEILDIASDNKVDCVLVCGDVFDSRAPSAEAEKIVYSFFAALVQRGIAAVIIGGNHDHPKRLNALRNLLDPLRILIRPEPVRPDDGGVIEFAVRTELARISVLPFVSERHIVDACAMMGPEQAWYAEYADSRYSRCPHSQRSPCPPPGTPFLGANSAYLALKSRMESCSSGRQEISKTSSR